jgi:hypothetical protein
VGLRDADLFCHFETSGVDMNPLSPEKILRNLEHGYFMTHQEQAEAAQYIRELQKINTALRESLIMNAEEVQRLRQQFGLWNKGEK